MSDTEIIKTLKVTSETSYKEKSSEFIGLAFPVKNEAEVQNYLDLAKKKYYDASHHCYAFKLQNNAYRYSDAGEPAGTAGVRILNAIEHFNITDILVVVVRYFGGTKLGVGPLGKAYYYCTEQLLKNCSFQEERPFNRMSILSEFNFISTVHHIISANSGIIENTEYGEKATFECLIPVNLSNKVLSELSNYSNGQILTQLDNKKIYRPF